MECGFFAHKICVLKTKKKGQKNDSPVNAQGNSRLAG